MDTIEFKLPYPADATRVAEAFWRVERWPGLAGHVTGIELHYEDDRIQVLTMRVNTRGSQAAFRTMRCRQRNRIYYFQPEPPPFLRVHGGWWGIDAADAGCVVTSHHAYEVEPRAAAQFAADVLGWDGRGEVSVRIGELLRANSLQTMEALRQALQGAVAAAA